MIVRDNRARPNRHMTRGQVMLKRLEAQRAWFARQVRELENELDEQALVELRYMKKEVLDDHT